MKEIIWSNQIGNRSRAAFLLLVAQGRIIPFTGESIRGVVVVVAATYTKSGKWSHTTYQLRLGTGVQAIAGREGWCNGTVLEGLSSATDLASEDGNRMPFDNDTITSVSQLAAGFGVSEDAVVEAMSAWRPADLERVREIEIETSYLV